MCRLWCLIILLSLIKYNDFFDQHDATLGTALSAPLSNRVQRHILNHFLEREIWPQSTEISKSYLFVHHEFEKWNWGHLKKKFPTGITIIKYLVKYILKLESLTPTRQKSFPLGISLVNVTKFGVSCWRVYWTYLICKVMLAAPSSV